MKTPLIEKRIEQKYVDLKAIFTFEDDHLNILLKLLSEELVIIADAIESISTHGLTISNGSMVRINPSVTVRQGSISSAVKIIKQIYLLNSTEYNGGVTTDLNEFLGLTGN